MDTYNGMDTYNVPHLYTIRRLLEELWLLRHPLLAFGDFRALLV